MSNEDRDSESISADAEGLSAGGFDWSGAIHEDEDEDEDDMADDVTLGTQTQTKKKRKGKPEIKIDQTGDLDKHGPQNSSDFERLLLGSRNSSDLWTQYMEFRLRLGEIDGARKLAERALQEIDIREQDEKKRIWMAYLALENGFGGDEDVEKVFARACQYADAQEIHDELASIYILSGKHEVRSSYVDCFNCHADKPSRKQTSSLVQ